MQYFFYIDKQPRTNDKGGPSAWGLGVGLK
jgi:hypothetical protein